MERMKNSCASMDKKLAAMLLDPSAAPARVRAHVAGCDRCRGELEGLQSTMALMDSWKADEPSPYFLTRLDARIREEQQAPSGWLWFERLHDRFTYGPYGPATHVRPLAAMALTIMLLVGGGTYLGITDWNQAAAPTGQATLVNDLQTLDNNAQLLDQLEALSSSSDNGNN